MSNVSFNKNGIISANNSGNVNSNILINSTKFLGTSSTKYYIGEFNLSESMIANSKYTISAHINTSSEKQTVGFFFSGGDISLKSWIPITEDGYYIATFTATSKMANNTSTSTENISVTPSHGFVKVYVSNNIGKQGSTPVIGTANVDWIKLEKSDVPTYWKQNINDYKYIENINNGFIETGNTMKIFNNYIETTEFIEC